MAKKKIEKRSLLALSFSLQYFTLSFDVRKRAFLKILRWKNATFISGSPLHKRIAVETFQHQKSQKRQQELWKECKKVRNEFFTCLAKSNFVLHRFYSITKYGIFCRIYVKFLQSAILLGCLWAFFIYIFLLSFQALSREQKYFISFSLWAKKVRVPWKATVSRDKWFIKRQIKKLKSVLFACFMIVLKNSAGLHFKHFVCLYDFNC